MSKPSPPAPPDPARTAGAQTATNIGTAIANTSLGQVNQYTPTGSIEYSRRQNADYDPNFRAPTIEELTSTTTTPGSIGRSDNADLDGPGLGGSGPSTTTSTRYQVGDQVFDTRNAAQSHLNSLNPQYATHVYTDPNTGERHEIPLYDATTTLAPGEQRIHDNNTDARQALAGTASDRAQFLQGYLSDNIDQGALPQSATTPGARRRQTMGLQGPLTRSYGTDFSQDRQRVEDAIMSRMQPQMDRSREALDARLANQGITPGSEAYNREMERMDQANTDAQMQAILAGGQEQSRMVGMERDRASFENAAQGQGFSQDMGRTGFNNQVQADLFGQDMSRANMQSGLRQQGLSEQFALRNQPINEITALLSGSQVNMPNFPTAQPSQIPTVDYAGLVNNNYNQQMANYQARNASRNDLLGGLMSLGASGIEAGWLG